MRQTLENALDRLFARERADAPGLPRNAAQAARFVYLVVQDFTRNRCFVKSAALSFQTVLSLVPALVLSLFVLRSVGGLDSLSRDIPQYVLHQLNVDEITLSVPREGGKAEQVKLSQKIETLVDAADRALRGGVSLISFLGLAAAALMLAVTLENSLNDIWVQTPRLALLRRGAAYWTALTLGPFLIGAWIWLTRWLNAPGSPLELMVDWLAPFGLLFLAYRLIPQAAVSARAAAAGAAAGALLWQLAKGGFGLYLKYAAGYGSLYGNLGLLPLFLAWIWVGWLIFLAGAECAYTLQNLSRLTAFERRRRLAPFAQPELVALGIVLRAGAAYKSGGGAVRAEELAVSTGLPDRLWTRLVAVLLERRLLAPAGRDGREFLPGRPLEQMLVDEVFTAIEETLVARPQDQWEDGHPRLDELRRGLIEARRARLAGKSIADLLRD